MSESAAIVSSWVAVPVGAVGLVLMAGHLIAVNHASMDARRKRIRMATTMLMMVMTPMLVYAASVATPRDPRGFVLSWMLVASILVMIIVLASIDILHSASLHRAEVRQLRQELARTESGSRDKHAPGA